MYNKAYNNVKDSVFVIAGVDYLTDNKMDMNCGTGFMVDDTHLISVGHICYHETTGVRFSDYILFKLNRSGNKYKVQYIPIKYLDDDAELDLSLFETSKKHPYISSSDLSINIGDLICTYGFHNIIYVNNTWNIAPHLSNGIVSGFDIHSDKYTFDKLMYKGSSGSPYFDIEGKCLGMQCRTQKNPLTNELMNFSLFTSLDVIRSFLLKNGIKY